MKHSLFLFCSILLLSVGCSRPLDNVLSDDQMVDILYDLYISEGYYAIVGDYQYETMTDEIVKNHDSLLRSHNTNADQLRASMDFYMAHPDRYKAIYQRVSDSIQAQLQQ